MNANPIQDRIYEFIKQFPPFTLLGEKTLYQLAGKVIVKYFDPTQTIFNQGDQPHELIYLVKEGSVDLTRSSNNHDELIDICDEGDLFGVRALITGKTYLTTAKTREETLLYAIPKKEFDPLLKSYPDLALYFATGFAAGQPVIRNSVQEASNKQLSSTRDSGLPIFNLDEVYSVEGTKELISCNKNTSIQDAARLMAEKRIGSLVIVNNKNAPAGIITDTDFRNKVVTGQVGIDEPVHTIMNAPVITISSGRPAAEVLIRMLKHHVHHLCVTQDGTHNSRVTGIISEHDLLLKQGLSPAVLIKEIQQGPTPAYLTKISNKVPDILKFYLEQEVSIPFLAEIITQIYDALVVKAIEITQKELAEENWHQPQYKFCWLALGSSGREEQLLRTDQDNAIIYENPADNEKDHVHQYFLKLGKKVNDILASCGFAYCPSNTMAGNPEYCQPLEVWQKYFRKWIYEPEPHALMKASIFFDYRPVFGDATLSEGITQYIFSLISKEQIFLNYLANNALMTPPPLSFFRNFLVERSGEHKNEFDIKLRGMLPLVDAARLLCLDRKITGINNTFQRFEKLAEIEPIKANLYREAAMGYEILMRFRARTGLAQSNSGRYINPASLNKIERQTLRNTFTPISQIQEMIRLKFQLDYFRI